MKKAIIVIISVLVVFTAVAIFALNKMGNEVIDSMIDSELASIEQTQTMNTNQQGKQNSDVTQDSQVKLGGDNVSNDLSGGTDSVAQNSGDSNNDVDNKSTKAAGKSAGKVITPQKVQEIKDKVTVSDKMTAASLILKRLTSDDIATLKSLLSGGMTPENKRKAIEIAYSRFKPEEILQIKELYHKYMK